MVLDGDRILHHRFVEFPDFLRQGDVLVLNETRVIAARLFGTRQPGGGSVEILVLRPAQTSRYDPIATSWLALLKPGRRMHPGTIVRLGEFGQAKVLAEREDGMREITFDLNLPFDDFLARAGQMPLPPYIPNATAQERAGYQTVFARIPGSVAAPTASLHFTPELLKTVEKRGVQIAKIVLNVGLGTFRPIESESLDDHRMHSESYSIHAGAAHAIKRAKEEGRRVIAAGTTAVRALEGCVAQHGELRVGDGETNIFITPGYHFAIVDALLTNFHLPKSTLYVLVSAFAGCNTIRAAYQEAIQQNYRFLSLGDAMLITHSPSA